MGTLNYFYWSYENRISKHFVIFLNFPCLTVLFAYVVFFLLVLLLGICVKVDLGRITILPPSLPANFCSSLRTTLSLIQRQIFETSARLKLISVQFSSLL